jgi:hypothetical protein
MSDTREKDSERDRESVCETERDRDKAGTCDLEGDPPFLRWVAAIVDREVLLSKTSLIRDCESPRQQRERGTEREREREGGGDRGRDRETEIQAA